MRLDADIRAVAEVAQTRRRAAAERVKRGEIVHLNFMTIDECHGKAEDNLRQMGVLPTGDGMVDLADVLNYGLAEIAKAKKAPKAEGTQSQSRDLA